MTEALYVGFLACLFANHDNNRKAEITLSLTCLFATGTIMEVMMCNEVITEQVAYYVTFCLLGVSSLIVYLWWHSGGSRVAGIILNYILLVALIWKGICFTAEAGFLSELFLYADYYVMSFLTLVELCVLLGMSDGLLSVRDDYIHRISSPDHANN